jgi:hypothetical protein
MTQPDPQPDEQDDTVYTSTTDMGESLEFYAFLAKIDDGDVEYLEDGQP